MNPTEALPLFPLPLVVFPGETLALHLFEPRYLEMLRDCLDQPNPLGDFVIVYTDGNGVDACGTAVRVSRVLQRNDDGSVDTLVEGVRRVQLQTRYQLKSYDSVQTEPDADLSSDWDEALATRVYALHRQLIFSAIGDEPSDRHYQQKESLAYSVAALSGLGIEQKRSLLRLRTEDERLQFMIEHLETLLPLFQRILPAWKDILGSYTLLNLQTPSMDS